MKTCWKWRNSAAENIIHNKDYLAMVGSWQYTPASYFILQEEGKLEGQTSYFTQWLTNLASVMFPSLLLHFIFQHALCATQIKSPDMTYIQYFYTEILRKGTYSMWVNMVLHYFLYFEGTVNCCFIQGANRAFQ